MSRSADAVVLASPGPWKQGEHYDNFCDEITDAAGRCLAVAWTRRTDWEIIGDGPVPAGLFRSDPVGEANAKLLAAADLLPELGAALTRLLDDLADADKDRNPVTGETYDSVAEARRVLQLLRSRIGEVRCAPADAPAP